jgi:hypothetical protein
MNILHTKVTTSLVNEGADLQINEKLSPFKLIFFSYFTSSCSISSLLNIILNDSKITLSDCISKLKHLCIR